VRLLYRYNDQGHDVDPLLYDFVNLLSGYFFFLALRLNALNGTKEIAYTSRNYK
jgi:cob(I)alamin adenosyltransferase